MAEAEVLEQPQTAPANMEIITPGANFFSDNAWSDTPLATIAPKPKPEDGGSATTNTTEAKPEEKPEEEIVDEFEYLAKQTGYKTWDEINQAKARLEELEKNANKPYERKFANEESKKLAEAWESGDTEKAWEYLDKQRRLSKAKDTSAEDAIKMHLREANPHYNTEDIQDIFEERYSMPTKPIKGIDEADDEFQARMADYNTRVAKVNRAIERDGFAAKQELGKMVTQLVPPEIQKQATQDEAAAQKALADRKVFLEGYVKAVPKGMESFNGFATKFKDDTVEIPIEFKADAEEKGNLQKMLETWATHNLDANVIFKDVWANKDGSINIQQVAEDLYLLMNRDKIFQKIANESGNKRLNHQMKINKNITINSNGKQPEGAAPTEKDAQAANIDFLWKNA
jgi:hypothetical protein